MPRVFALLEGTRITEVVVATKPPAPAHAELAAPLDWRQRPSRSHCPHWIGGAVVWQDSLTPAQALAAAAATARAERDRLLLQSDWVVTRAIERAEAVPPAWLPYRQALRDITAQPGFPQAVVWPQQPGQNA
jgi:hypothetical protein